MCLYHPYPVAQPIVLEPVEVVQNAYFPQIVPIIHTVKVIQKNHPVPIPNHIYNVIREEENCTVSSVKNKRSRSKSKAKR